jgi:hypothetical protein
LTATEKTARPHKSEPKTTAAPKKAAVKSKKEIAASVNVAAKQTTNNLVLPNQSSTSMIEEITELLVHLPFNASVERSRQLFTSISSRFTGHPERG